MANYRKRLVDMSTEERAEVAPAAEQFKNIFGSRSKKPLSVKGSEIGLEFTPAGTVFGLNDIRNELKKENPDYYLIGLMGGAEIIGLIPGLDKAAIDAIRAGAKRITGSKKIDQTLEAFEKPDPKKVVEQKILAGPGAKDYSNRSLHKAQQLKAEGYSPKKIEEITGRVQVGSSEDYIPNELIKNPQAPFKFEIPDKGIIIKKNDGYITLREASKQRPIRVGNLIPTHTKLFEQYPDLKNTAFYIDPKLGRGAHFDSTDGTYGSIVIGPDHPGISKIIEEGNVNNPEFRRVFFHELQHAAQARDFHYTALRQLGGGSETYTKAVSGRDPFGKDFTKAAIAKNPKLAELRDKMVKLFKEDTRGLDSTSKVSYGSFGQEVTQVYNNPETAKKMAELMKELDYESYKTYLQTASEVEAATVGARAKPTFAKDQPLVSSEVSKRKDVETYDDYARGYSDSKIKKLLKRMTTRKADLTEKEISDLAGRGVNFVRYALEIDDELVGFSEGGLATQMDNLFGYTAKGAEQEGKRLATDVNTELTFKDAATFVAEATPIIGDAIAAKEVYDELKKENPNYLLVGALGGAALIGLIPGLGDAAAASIRKGARSALDTSKRMIPTKKVDDAYNPVIGFGGEDSYDRIISEYLNPIKPSAEEKLVSELNKVTDNLEKDFGNLEKEILQEIEADKILKLIDKDKDELQAIKDSGLFDNETDLLMAHTKGVLSTPEYFRSKYDFMQTKLNSLDPSDPKYKEYEKFTDVYDRVDLASLLDFARDYPVEPTPTGALASGDPYLKYLEYGAMADKYDKKLVEYADDVGVDPSDFIDVVKDAIPFVGESPFPDYLPRAKETGDLYPRKATDYTQSNTESLLAKIPTKTDRAASKLGFDDTVYHLAVSEDEFTKFKNVDDLIPEIRDGPTDKFQGTSHDLLGVHVGTARAAAERFRAKSVDFTESPRYTMQLRARLDKPVRVEDVSEIIGFDPLKLELDDSGLNFTEKDLKTIIKQKAIQKNTTGDYISTTMENQAAIELRKELADAGFTHIPYVNELEDKDSISYIMLVDRKKGDPAVLRDYNAKFDPEKAASTDLRMFGGGLSQ